MTILNNLLTFAGSSIAGGITWDALKGAGQYLMDAFVKKYMGKYFENKEQCDEFFRILSTQNSLSKKNPYKDVELIYEEITDGNVHEDFCSELKQWIEENKKELETLVDIKQQNGTVNIAEQNNSGTGTVVNAGIYNSF